MNEILTPHAAALRDLVDRVTALSSSPGDRGPLWWQELCETLLATPFLEDVPADVFEMVLAWAGVDLTDPVALRCAARVAAILIGSYTLGLSYITDEDCEGDFGHEPGMFGGVTAEGASESALFTIATSDELRPVRHMGQDLVETDERGRGLRLLRSQRLADYLIVQRCWQRDEPLPAGYPLADR